MEKTEIKQIIMQYIKDTGEHDLICIVSYLIGYCGVITPEIWYVVTDLVFDGVITRTHEPH